MRSPKKPFVAATHADIRINRLGLISQQQLQQLDGYIAASQQRVNLLARRTIKLACFATLLLVLLALVRVILLPVALLLEIVLVSFMLFLTAGMQRFVRQLARDRDDKALRLIKGRASRSRLQAHPLYHRLNVELQSYRLLDPMLARQLLRRGELYQYYVLPHSRVIIAAEAIGETAAQYRGY